MSRLDSTDGDSASSSPVNDELSKQDKEAVRSLMAGMCTVVSYRCAVDENHDLLRSLELYNKAYWDKLGTQKDSLPNDPENVRRQRVKKREKERRKQELKQKIKSQESQGDSSGARRGKVPASAPATPGGTDGTTVDIAPIDIEKGTPRDRPHSGGLPRISSKSDLESKVSRVESSSPANVDELGAGEDPYPDYGKDSVGSSQLSVNPNIINGRPPRSNPTKTGSRRNLLDSESENNGNGKESWGGEDSGAKSGTVPTKPKRQGSFPRKVSATWKNNSTARSASSSSNASGSANDPPSFSFANPLPVSTGNPNGNAFAKKLSDMAYLTTETKRIEKKKQKVSERNSLSTSFEKILAASRAKNNSSSRDVASSRWNI